MTNEINQILEELRNLIVKENSNITHVSINLNQNGIQFDCRTAKVDLLKKNNISMKNIAGEWIR